MRAPTATRLAPVLGGLLLLSVAAGAAGATSPGLRAEVAALLMQGVAGGSLPIAVAVFPEPPADAAMPGGLAFVVELPPAPPGEGDGERPLEIYAYAVDEAGEVAGYFALALPEWPADGPGVKVAGRLEAEGQDLSLRFLAWDPAARRYGLAVLRTGPGAAAPPRVADECGDWTVAGSDPAGLAGLSARPVLVTGETQRLSLGRPPPPGGWRVRLHGGALGAPPMETEVTPAAATGTEIDFAVPDLPPVRVVRFLVNGHEAGSVGRRPYRLTVDLGEQFGPHLFEAVVLGPVGELTRIARRTPGLRVDDSVDLGLRQLYVAVEGEAVDRRPLAAEDFTVIDAGARQQIVTFEGGDAALAVAVLVDASDSMSGGALRAALEGARALLDGLRELDEAAPLLFADGLIFRGPYAPAGEAVAQAVAPVSAAGGTALNDALYVSLRQLDTRQGRRVIVLLSDGLDIHSALDVDQVLWAMRRSGSVVYWIELRTARSDDRVRSPWRTDDQHDAERAGLRRLVADSGGRVVPIEGVADAAGAFGSILAELRGQVVLGYYPTVDRDDGGWHPVSVRVGRRGMRARTRRGYVDD